VAENDSDGRVFFSGSDDCLIKVWDIRTSSIQRTQPASSHSLNTPNISNGVLYGHCEGITHLDSKGDGRYLISNSKDQSIKLWDIRKVSPNSRSTPLSASTPDPKKQARERLDHFDHSFEEPDLEPGPYLSSWDYRLGIGQCSSAQQKVFSGKLVHRFDQSLMSYRSNRHKVFRTLVKCYFSPILSTAQKYIISGSASGDINVFDILTGELVRTLSAHRATVRDVAWNPSTFEIASGSFDGTLRFWYHFNPR